MVVQSVPKLPYPVATTFPTFFERSTYRTYNWLENRLWPVRPLPFLTISIGAATFNLRMTSINDIRLDTFDQVHQKILKTLAISFGSTYAAIFVFRKFLKYFYFGYKGCLFENPKQPSTRTKLWGLLRKILLKVAPPKLSSCDLLLPNLPLPNLEDSVTRYVQSMKPLMSDEEYTTLLVLSKEFLNNEGPRIQRLAWVLHKCTDNYVTPLWEKFIYHAGRYPLLINSSTAEITTYGESQCIQAYEVARLLYIETLATLAVDRQEYMAVGDGLLSTRLYKNIYNGCRVPGKEYDHFEWRQPGKYAVIVHEGTWYKVDVCDKNGKIFSIDQFSKIVTELMSRNDKEKGVLSKIGALTSDDRTQWHENRQKYFLKNKQNKKLLEIIETSIFVACIDGNQWEVETPESLSKYAKDMLTGDGCNRWFDKTMNYSIGANGRGGASGEHSPCDGAEMDHLCENFINIDRQILETPSKEVQNSICQMDKESKRQLILAQKLEFELVDETMKSEIERCYKKSVESINELHLRSLSFMDFGKGRVKKCGISPDGFVQMAIQLASYKDQGKFLLTYESGSVRCYANSRTETIRPVTEASCKFVRSMLDDNFTKQDRAQLLRDACLLHVQNNKEVMAGRGFDRHIFVLCVISKAFGYKSEFLDQYSTQKWTLSTSNIPNMTNSVDEDSSNDNIMLGGSFGAVTQDGYGVCYRFGGNGSIMVHITSYHSAPNTDSDRFANLLHQCFHDLADLFDN